MRKKIIAGNWKMNKTPAEAKALCELLKDKVNTTDADVVFCVPFVDLYPVLEALKDTNIAVGAENMHFEESGAYTGEISAAIIELNPDTECTEEEINEFCKELPRYKRPRKVIFAEVPRNATGKIEKPKLREIYHSKNLVDAQNRG